MHEEQSPLKHKFRWSEGENYKEKQEKERNQEKNKHKGHLKRVPEV